jgi:DDE family transposase
MPSYEPKRLAGAATMVPQARLLIAVLAEIPDFQSTHGNRHLWGAILALTCSAMLCGYRSYTAMAEWGRHNGAHQLWEDIETGFVLAPIAGERRTATETWTLGRAVSSSAGCRRVPCWRGTVTGRGWRTCVTWRARSSSKKLGKSART